MRPLVKMFLQKDWPLHGVSRLHSNNAVCTPKTKKTKQREAESGL